MVHACSVFPQLCLQSLCLKGLNFEGNSLSSWRPVKSARITLNKPQGREEAHGIRWSMHFFIPEHMVVACKLGNNLFFQRPDAVLHSGWLPRTFPLPRAAPPHSWIKRMLAEMSIKASFSHLKIEWKEGDDPESGQKQLPRRGRKIHQCSVKNYVSECAEFCGKLLNPSFSEKKDPKSLCSTSHGELIFMVQHSICSQLPSVGCPLLLLQSTTEFCSPADCQDHMPLNSFSVRISAFDMFPC